ncbi:MAG TPA: hypothetical protein VJT73_13990 [Polyangiaceae bacterium]|nr:hypothetical protein [Polyangiaceae bacterium]
MRTTIILATFLGVGAGAVGVGAVPELMKGSDTLFDITQDVIKTCLNPVGGVQPLLDINYTGTGSSNGESAMVTVNPAVQRISPMSRFLQKGTAANTVCSPADPAASAAKAEGLTFGLDGISLVASKDTGASTTCNGTTIDCSRATDPTAGLAKTRTLTVTVNEIVPGPNGSIEETNLAGDDVYAGSPIAIGAERVLPGPNGVIDTAKVGDDVVLNKTVVYTFDDWKDVLKVIFAGRFSHSWTENGVTVSTTNDKECDNIVRHAVVENYGNLFQTACTTGGCTQLHHAFRRDDVSGTTDTFITLLGLKATAWVGSTVPATGAPNYFSAFCNGFSQNAPGQGAPPCDIRRNPEQEPTVSAAYDWDFQDWDPIRRKCTDDEKVCGRNGTLGLVLAMLPTDFLTDDQAYPPVQAKPSLNFKSGQNAPKAFIVGRGDVAQARCPNGGLSTGTFKCVSPWSDTDKNGALVQQLSTINTPANSQRAGVLGSIFCGFRSTQADGRVYNLYLRGNTTPGVFVKDQRAVPGPREIYGAFYRLHQVAGSYTSSAPDIIPSDSAPLPAPLTSVCVNRDATKQIGCLASVSKCSIGYAGRSATDSAAAGFTAVEALKLDALDPTDECIRKVVTDLPNAYPLSRSLYLNTAFGFENLSNADERAMAQCFSKSAFIDPILTSRDFVTLGQAPFCVDFNEQATGSSSRCALPLPKTQACGDNQTGSGAAVDPRATNNGVLVPNNTDKELP